MHTKPTIRNRKIGGTDEYIGEAKGHQHKRSRGKSNECYSTNISHHQHQHPNIQTSKCSYYIQLWLYLNAQNNMFYTQYFIHSTVFLNQHCIFFLASFTDIKHKIPVWQFYLKSSPTLHGSRSNIWEFVIARLIVNKFISCLAAYPAEGIIFGCWKAKSLLLYRYHA